MQNTLLLVDGSSYLYRAFHAMPDLRNPQGEPTGAIYGMINMLRRLRSDYPAAYMACVFDAKGKTFRDDLYPEYKAQRAPMPDDLRLQIEPIHEVVKAMGWPILMVEGVEADDVIGTLAVEASKLGMNTVVSTGDKDLAQLVNPQVMLINTMTNEKMDEPGVLAKFGVQPNRIIDYLTLIGDTVDNVPGVTKCGPKTAVKWLTEFDSLDGVIANADKIKGVVGDNLRAALEWLPRGRELITVKTDCDLAAHYQSIQASLVSQAESKEAMLAFFTRYGFKTWLRELSGDATAGATPLSSGSASASSGNTPAQAGLFNEDANANQSEAKVVIKNYETVLTEAALDEWIHRINAASLTAVDTETTSLEPMTAQLVGISLCCEVGHACYIPVAHNYGDCPTQLSKALVLEKLKSWLEDDSKAKVGQNLKYDTHIFANQGVHLRGIKHDTLLESYVFESHKSHDMDSLALRHLGKKPLALKKCAAKALHKFALIRLIWNALPPTPLRMPTSPCNYIRQCGQR